MSEPIVTVAELTEEFERRGFLNKKLYVVHTKPAHGMGPVMENLPEHLQFQIDITNEGIMFAAGPIWTDDEKYWKGEGMVLLRAGSLEEARQIAERDPMHKSGARTFTVRPWVLNEGVVNVKLDYVTGKFELS